MLSFFIFSNSPILCQVSFQLYSNFISTIFTRASKFKRVRKKTQINFLDLYVILWILTIYYLLDKFSTHPPPPSITKTLTKVKLPGGSKYNRINLWLIFFFFKYCKSLLLKWSRELLGFKLTNSKFKRHKM